MDFYVQSTKDTIPAKSTIGVVTITTTGNTFVTSAATALEVGDWIYVAAQNAVRRIQSFTNDTDKTQGTLSGAFGVDLAAGAIEYVKGTDLEGVYSISVVASGGDVSVNGEVLAADLSINPSIPEATKKAMDAVIKPIVLDASTNSATVLVQKLESV